MKKRLLLIILSIFLLVGIVSAKGGYYYGAETVSSGFTPSGSPVGHWSADTITGLEDGDPVATWPDQGGNGYDLVQATPVKRPTYKTGIQNELPIVRCSGQSMQADFEQTYNQPNTYFVVARNNEDKDDQRQITDGGSDGARAIIMKLAQWTLYAGASLASSTNRDQVWHTFAALFNGDNSILNLDGLEIANGAAGAANPTGVTLASRFGQTSGFWNGDIGELIMYDGSEAFANNEAGLKTKWDTP